MNRLVQFFIFTIISIVSVCAAKSVVVERPHIAERNNTILYIDEVRLEKDSTTIKFHAFFTPNNWIKIVGQSYLNADGKKYALRNAQSIILDQEYMMPMNGEAEFSLSFEALPLSTKKFSFIEGDTPGAFRLEDIDLAKSSENSSFMAMKQDDTNFNDMLKLLKDAGYENFSFDISPLLQKEYIIQLVVQEYENGKLMNVDNSYSISNKRHISDFSEEDQREILMSGRAVDPERDIYKQCNRINFRCQPANDDVLYKDVFVEFEEMATFFHHLPLKKIKVDDFEVCKYAVRPFENYEFRDFEFCPLLMCGSYWVDDRYGIIRFCGENFIPKDISGSLLLKNIPHYYIIGIRPLPQN